MLVVTQGYLGSSVATQGYGVGTAEPAGTPLFGWFRRKKRRPVVPPVDAAARKRKRDHDIAVTLWLLGDEP